MGNSAYRQNGVRSADTAPPHATVHSRPFISPTQTSPEAAEIGHEDAHVSGFELSKIAFAASGDSPPPAVPTVQAKPQSLPTSPYGLQPVPLIPELAKGWTGPQPTQRSLFSPPAQTPAEASALPQISHGSTPAVQADDTDPAPTTRSRSNAIGGIGDLVDSVLEELSFLAAKKTANPALKAKDTQDYEQVKAGEKIHIHDSAKNAWSELTTTDPLIITDKTAGSGGLFMAWSSAKKAWVAFKASQAETVNQSGFKPVDTPLFPEDDPPSAAHVKQTTLGDCYLQAALASIAAQNPSYIKDMMRDSTDGTVAVRLYEVDQSDHQNHKFKPKFIRVEKSVPQNQYGREVYNAGALWVRMVEKAYAAGGFTGNGAAPKSGSPSYEDIEGGFSRHAFEVILGQASQTLNLGGGPTYDAAKDQYADPSTVTGTQGKWVWSSSNPVGLPWDTNAIKQYDQVKANTPDDYTSLALLMQIFSNDKGKVDEWIVFAKTGKLKDLFKAQATDIGQGNSTAITLTDIGQLFEGKSFKDPMLKWLGDQKMFPGDLGSALYSKTQLDTFDKVQDALAKGQPVAASTNQKITKGKGGSGASGGEQTYGGLAGGHAYSVLATKATKTNSPDDAEPGNFKWVQIRNPWGSHAFAKDEAPLPGFIPKGDGVFFLELSQLTKYFTTVDIGTMPK